MVEVVSQNHLRRAWKKFSSQALLLLTAVALVLASGCGTTDAERLKSSRQAYLRDDFAGSEAALYSPEVFKSSENRLGHYLFLASIGMSSGQYEKAAFFLNKARDIAIQVRSSSGTFEWFSKDYRSNPIEFSYLHSMLVMAYTMLAEAGNTPAWNTSEIRDDHGAILMQAQNFEARTYDAREISGFKQKARSELLAWDSFFENLKNTYPTENFYKEDLWARMLASYLHSGSDDHTEKRTAELLAEQMKKIFTKETSRYPSSKQDSIQVDALIQKLKDQATGKSKLQSMLVCEAGISGKYKIQRFHLGLSTLFGAIKDPGLRSMMEQVGMQVLLNEAPEFGLIALGGGIAGAIGSGDSEDDDGGDAPPRFFTDAVDRSFGFEMRFPTLRYPPADTTVVATFTKPGGVTSEFQITIVSPLQEIIAAELRAREKSEMFQQSVKIGSQYLALLIPAVVAYKQAGREGNLFKKIAILAGYFIAKRAIDHANNPDLRNWNYLPKLIAADLIPLPAGEYDAKLIVSNRFGREEKSLGKVQLGNQVAPVILKRVGDLPILNHSEVF